MSDVANKLRLMNAAPQLLEALERLLPLVLHEAQLRGFVVDSLEAIGEPFKPRDPMRKEADRWLEGAMLAQLAVDAAKGPQPALRRDNVREMRLREMGL